MVSLQASSCSKVTSLKDKLPPCGLIPSLPPSSTYRFPPVLHFVLRVTDMNSKARRHGSPEDTIIAYEAPSYACLRRVPDCDLTVSLMRPSRSGKSTVS